MDTNGQDDEDFPLADHPGPSAPKAGDPETNRARDLQHFDVTRRAGVEMRMPRSPEATREAVRRETMKMETPTGLPDSAPVVIAWEAFKKTERYVDPLDDGWSMFLAGWTARDSQ